MPTDAAGVEPLPQWMTAVMEGTDALLVVTDRNGMCETASKAFCELTGYSAEELAGSPLWDLLLFPEDKGAICAEFQRLFSGEVTGSRFQNRWKMKDGSPRILSWANTVTQTPGGHVEYVVSSALDQTELASLSSECMKEQAASRRNMSRYLHDTVSQSLVVLALTLGKLELAPDREEPFELAPTLDLINDCCRDLRVISFALAPPLFEDVGPAESINWYVRQLREDTGIDVEFASDPELQSICDETRALFFGALQQWAERAMRLPKVGRTRIRLGRLASRVQLELSSDQPDSGAVSGVAASSVIRERVRAMGGTLELAPREPGFSVLLSIPAV